MDVATFKQANSENLHLSANVPAEIASDPLQKASDRLRAAEIIRDNALGKDAVNQQVNINAIPTRIELVLVSPTGEQTIIDQGPIEPGGGG
jgi:hypothetical protein